MKHLFRIFFLCCITIFGIAPIPAQWEQIQWPSYGGRIYYVTGNTLYAASNTGILISSDNGNSWYEKKLFQDYILLNISWVKSGSNLYAIGTDDNLIKAYFFKSTDDGNSWNIFFQLDTGANLNKFYAVGDTLIGSFLSGEMIVSIDGGRSWVYQNLPFYSSASVLWFTGPLLVLTENYFGYYVSKDLGLTWDHKPILGIPENSTFNFIYGDKYFFSSSGSNRSFLYYTSDFGGNWYTCKAFPPGWHNVQNLSGDNFLYDIEDYPLYGNGETYFSVDSGSTWNQFGGYFYGNFIYLSSSAEYYFCLTKIQFYDYQNLQEESTVLKISPTYHFHASPTPPPLQPASPIPSPNIATSSSKHSI